jgi:hypothetical protein
MRPAVRAVLIAAALLTLGACTRMQWVKAEATPEQFKQDLAQCDEHAWREAQHRAWAYRPLTPMMLGHPYRRGLFSPFSPFAEPFGDPSFEESRLAHFCMRAKGYELRPAERKDG